MKTLRKAALTDDGQVVLTPDPSGVEELDLPAGTFVTVVEAKDHKEPTTHEFRLPGTPGQGPPDGTITGAQFRKLLSLGLIQADSSSGWDPELFYIYDHYEVV